MKHQEPAPPTDNSPAPQGNHLFAYSVEEYDAGNGKSELEDDQRTAAAKQGRVPMLYTKAGVDSPTLGAEYGKQWLADYTAKRYHQVTDEYSPDWDVSGTLQDLQLYYDVGLDVANSSRWPNWRADSEFRAIRDQSRK